MSHPISCGLESNRTETYTGHKRSVDGRRVAIEVGTDVVIGDEVGVGDRSGAEVGDAVLLFVGERVGKGVDGIGVGLEVG
jgi:hypothetical protein